MASANDAPSSFSKSLYFGHIPEQMVIPYPRPAEAERERLRGVLEAFRTFAEAEIDPQAIDQAGRLGDGVLAGLKRLGMFGLAIDREHGGLGLSATGFARVMQEVGGIDASVALTLAAHQSIGCRGLLLFGTEEQRRRYLPRLATGESIAAFALTEPGAGSDAAAIQSRATPEPDGGFRLDGGKVWVTNGGLADLFTVFAQTAVEKDGQRKDRLSAFLVERGPQVTSGPEVQKLGVRGASTTAVTFSGTKVPRQNVIGQVGGGFKVAMGVLNSGRLGLAASAVGAARQAIRIALAHATTRRQFGRPLSEFSIIKDKLGRMMLELFAAESMVYLTTGLVDRGVEDYSVESACCKVYASEMLVRIVEEALSIAAGLGYLQGQPWERMLRDARAYLVFEGTSEVLRCYIALTGMQGPGDRLAQLADFIRWPLKGYGLAIDFVVDKLKTQYYGGERVDHAHPMLKKEAVLFEDWVPELAKNVEKSLRKHGKMISEMQYVQRRVADITIDLYMMIACIARTTEALKERGPGAEREAKLCRAVCGRASARIKRNIRLFDDNDDELIKAIAKDATDEAAYPFDLVLG